MEPQPLKMKKNFPATPQSPASDSDGIDQVREQSLRLPSKLVTIADCFHDEKLPWIAASPIPADLFIQVDDVTFNVHKYPFISKCGYIRRLDIQPSISNSGYNCKLENFPGGSETFHVILRFCYGLPIDFSPKNIAQLRCASEYLEMTEEVEDGNLISKTEAFLTFVVLSSWRDTIIVLKTCEALSPWAENIQMVRRCCDSIAWKAFKDCQSTGEAVNKEGPWFDEVATLRINHFVRIMTAIRAKGTKPETIGKFIVHYAERRVVGMDTESEGLRGYGYSKNELQFSVISRKDRGVFGNSKEQRTIIESIISLIPPQQEAVSCKFLLKMLKMAILYSVTPALVSELEKRIGMMLQEATVQDLLIPNYKSADQSNSPECTMHDIDVVQRILEYFLMHEQQQQQPRKSGKFNVSKLLDNYLAEIARDPNLSVTEFQVLAESLPESARTCDDGLYRAIDIYLKSHPTLSEHDRRRLCKIMNCAKLSLDACNHAAQNERLPMRTVMQVLFSEQLKMREAVQGKEQEQSGNNSEQEENQPSTEIEIKILRAELENVKAKMAELQNDYNELQQEYDKLNNKQRNGYPWSSGWRKIKNSFHAKQEGDGIGDGENRPSPARRCRGSLRRSSMS
ncbi:BTB/POZ domain-containing protein DOT3 isoform X1 [Eucalyptus grandis]|uniref:BTB/POZ domain-containing protein DOT3 isoform X1 n=1 Tax=Eucalyptus grandis TaxID=71139 RepID=UPI00192ECCA8|nr:BTB/POZ domain-containing protein DOT3 isoform X1 [Eucalyptus grandis]